MFYDALQGKKWDHFNSDKRCDINYGRIQGLDELLRNFADTSMKCEKHDEGMGDDYVQTKLSSTPLLLVRLLLSHEMRERKGAPRRRP